MEENGSGVPEVHRFGLEPVAEYPNEDEIDLGDAGNVSKGLAPTGSNSQPGTPAAGLTKSDSEIPDIEKEEPEQDLADPENNNTIFGPGKGEEQHALADHGEVVESDGEKEAHKVTATETQMDEGGDAKLSEEEDAVFGEEEQVYATPYDQQATTGQPVSQKPAPGELPSAVTPALEPVPEEPAAKAPIESAAAAAGVAPPTEVKTD